MAVAAWTRASALGLILTAAVAAAPAGPVFTIGVLRLDGLLTPFAAFDGKRWSAPWPVELTGEPVPPSVALVPPKWWGPIGPGAAWRLLSAGAPPQPLMPTALQVSRVFCATQLQLRTAYRSRDAIDPRDPTVGKAGLAVAGDVAIDPIASIDPRSARATAMATTITEAFNVEERHAAHAFTDWRHPYTDEEREQVPIRIEAFYQHEETSDHGPWTASYVEAVRAFPPKPEDRGCGLITYARGWVMEAAGREPRINLGARVTYCDRANITFMFPLGAVHVDGDAFWIYQLSSWRDEIYDVTRVRPDGIKPEVAVAGGGNCPWR